jgi:prepilin signal peptidase PulO-like enzyme (type II secretory pathway)
MFDWSVGTTLFILGIFFGSFLNVVSDRLYRKENFLTDRSKCDYCGHKLEVKNLIPLISFFIQKGKCTYCHKKLSLLYPISEIITGISFLLAYFITFTLNQELNYLIYLLIIFSLFLIISFTDYKFYEIPFEIIVSGSVFAFLYRILVLKNLTLENLFVEVISVVIIFTIFYLIIYLSKGGMGGGDLKLACFISIVVGYPANISALYFGFILGGLFGILVLLLKFKKLKSQIPFGPFLILGAVLSLLYSLF